MPAVIFELRMIQPKPKPTAKPFTTEATEAHRGILIWQKATASLFSHRLTRIPADKPEFHFGN